MRRILAAAAIPALLSAGAVHAQEQQQPIEQAQQEVRAIDTATAELMGPDGTSYGTLTLSEIETGVRVEGTLEGLPDGLHGFHIHEAGVCEPPDFQSAGGHFNPTGMEHGFGNPRGPHLGDMLNILVENGTAEVVRFARDVNVTGTEMDHHPLIDDDGASVVVHADADDLETNPAGNAGARIACGVIRPQES